MQPNDTPFMEGALDAQLDALADALARGDGQTSATPTSLAYRQLRALYAAQAEQEAQSVARVGERLARHAASVPEAPAPLRTRELPSAYVAPPLRVVGLARRTRRPPLTRRAAIVRSVAAALVVVVVGAFVLLRLGGANSPATNSYHWTTIPNPNTTQAVNELTGITMRSATDGWAWGSSQDAPSNANSNPISAPLVEHWDGKSWRIVPTPAMPYGGELTDIVSLAPDNAWAVGDQLITPTWSQDTTGGAVIEHWDGARWTMVPSNIQTAVSTDDTSLTKLAALAPNDIWAVGTYGGATSSGVIDHWDGRQWQEVSQIPAAATQFTSIAAVAPTDIWVFGPSSRDSSGGVIEHWDGVQWRLISSPSRLLGKVFIKSASAVSANDVWAVGWQETFVPIPLSLSTPLIEHWDGKSWSVVSSPAAQNASLASVAALGPDDAWAVGIQAANAIDVAQVGQSLVEHWDGQQWSLVTNPNPQGYTALQGVAGDATMPGKVWVVGVTGPATSQGDQPSDTRAFIETGQP